MTWEPPGLTVMEQSIDVEPREVWYCTVCLIREVPESGGTCRACPDDPDAL